MRIKLINKYFIFHLYTNVCQSLFQKNKLHFAFLVCTKIQMDKNLIGSDEWKHFLAGSINSVKQKSNPANNWLATRSWEQIQNLEKLKAFEKFTNIFSEYLNDFKILFDAQHPEK